MQLLHFVALHIIIIIFYCLAFVKSVVVRENAHVQYGFMFVCVHVGVDFSAKCKPL